MPCTLLWYGSPYWTPESSWNAFSEPFKAFLTFGFCFRKSLRSNRTPDSLKPVTWLPSTQNTWGSVPSDASSFMFLLCDSVSAASNCTLYFPLFSLLKASTIAFVAGSCLAGFATLMPNLITVAPSASFVALVFPPHPASIPTIIVAAAVADNTVINAFFFMMLLRHSMPAKQAFPPVSPWTRDISTD